MSALHDDEIERTQIEKLYLIPELLPKADVLVPLMRPRFEARVRYAQPPYNYVVTVLNPFCAFLATRTRHMGIQNGRFN